MKKIGMIGGLAWPSTLDYYRLLCSRTNQRAAAAGVGAPLPTPPMVIESVDIHHTRGLRGTVGDEVSWEPFEAFFRGCLNRLEHAGAEVAFIASNTPHTRFAGITRHAQIPVISIVDASAALAARVGADRTLVLGTPVIMQAPTYVERLAAHDLSPLNLMAPDDVQQLASLIDNELYRGDLDTPRDWMMDRCRAYRDAAGIDTVCLACTELPLAFPEHADEAVFSIDGIRFINTTVAHAEAVLTAATID